MKQFSLWWVSLNVYEIFIIINSTFFCYNIYSIEYCKHRNSNELLCFYTLKKLAPLIAVLLFTSLSPFIIIYCWRGPSLSLIIHNLWSNNNKKSTAKLLSGKHQRKEGKKEKSFHLDHADKRIPKKCHLKMMLNYLCDILMNS